MLGGKVCGLHRSVGRAEGGLQQVFCRRDRGETEDWVWRGGVSGGLQLTLPGLLRWWVLGECLMVSEAGILGEGRL